MNFQNFHIVLPYFSSKTFVLVNKTTSDFVRVAYWFYLTNTSGLEYGIPNLILTIQLVVYWIS